MIRDKYQFSILLPFTLSCIVGFLMIEVLSRIFLDPPVVIEYDLGKNVLASSPKGNSDASIETVHNDPNTALKINTESGFRLRPNASVNIRNHYAWGSTVTIRTNSLGYRNREIGVKEGRRILFLGDSITWGDWLPEEDTFVRIVESLAAKDSVQWETINAAVGGISLSNQIAILLETGLSTEPDAVVVNFYLNDFLESPGVHLPRIGPPFNKSYFLYNLFTKVPIAIYQMTGRGWRIRQAAFAELDLEQLREAFHENEFVQSEEIETESATFKQLIYKHFFDWGGSWSPAVWSHLDQMFRYLKELSETHSFELYIVAHPVRYQTEAISSYDYPQRRLQLICSELDVPLLDLMPILKNHKRKEEIFLDHCHHTSYGNQLVASAIYSFLSNP